jgi:hypothetical protein
MMSANRFFVRLSTAAFLLAMIATFGLHLGAQEPPAVNVGDTKVTGLPTDWSHRHVIYGNPGTEQDSILNGTHEQWLRIVNDPRYVVQNLKKSLSVQGPAQQDVEMRQRIADQEFRTRGPRDGRNLRHEKPDPGSVALDRDWSMDTGGSAAALTLTISAPTSSNTNNGGASTLVIDGQTFTASAPTLARETGAFTTGNPTNGQIVTVGTQQLTASVSAQATGTITVAANACFQNGQGVNVNGVSLTTNATVPTGGSITLNSTSKLVGDVVTIGGVAYNYESALTNAGCGTTLNCVLQATGTTELPNSAEALARAVNATPAPSCTNSGTPTACYALATGQGANAAVTASYTANSSTVSFSGWQCAGTATNLLFDSRGENIPALTGGGAGTTGSKTFALGTNAQTATNIISAVNTNKAATFVTAASGGTGVVNLTAVTGGSAGNLYTLTLSGTPTGVTLSSPAFSGGTDGTNTGTNFLVDFVPADNAASLALAIGQYPATTGVTVANTPGSATLTITAATPGTGANGTVTTSAANSHFSWQSTTLGGNGATAGTNGTANGTNFRYWTTDGTDTYVSNTQLATNIAAAITANPTVSGVMTAAANSGATNNLVLTAKTVGAGGNSYSETANNFGAVSPSSGSLAGGLGGGQPGVYPAKWALSSETGVNCAGDYVVYPTGMAGSSTSATIIAYNNMYATGCTAPVPTVYWSYNTGPGTVVTSPVIAFYGNKVAFIETQSGGAAVLRLVKFASGAGNGTDYSAPASFTGANSFTNTTTGTAWTSCTASPCMISVALQNGDTDTNSSPYYDAVYDAIYVGDNSGVLHKFTGVFLGTPAEVTAGGWPITLGGILTSPVLDPGTGSLFVGSSNGSLYQIPTPSSTPGTAIQSGPVAQEGSTGIVDSPIADATAYPAASTIYVFVGDSLTANQSAVIQFSPTFIGGNTGLHTATMGANTGSTALTVYDGDFDNAHYSGSGTTGNLYFCGGTVGTAANPALYEIPIGAGGLGSVVPIESLTNGAATCSPATEFYNTSSGGAHTTVVGAPTIAGAASLLESNISASATIVPLYNGGFTVGDYIEIDQEYMLIQSIAGNNLTVFRGQLGSTESTHNQYAVVLEYTLQLSAYTPTVNVVSVAGILAGDYIQVGSEDMSVTVVNVATNSLTVTRGALGTAQVAHANGAAVTIPALDWLFLSVTANGTGTNCRGACLYNYYLGGSGLAANPSATTGQAASGGTSGIVIDNGFTSAGASQIYYSTQSGQTCAGQNGTGPTGHGTGACAVQASQTVP